MGNQVIVVHSEDALKISLQKLEKITSKYGQKKFNKQNENNGF